MSPIRGLVETLRSWSRRADRLTPSGAERSFDGRPPADETAVAIACQGGGSHAAFTAGALGYLLENLPDSYTVRGLSGTSGGAVCAAAAWYGLVSDARSPAALLEALWSDVAATSGWERWLNRLAVSKARRATAGFAPKANPYKSPGADWGRRHLEDVLREHVEFDAFPELFAAADRPPHLLVGAVNVLTGEPVTFANGDVTAEAVLASAALPTLFKAVEVEDDFYWDGVFAGNPPIREFVTREAVGPIDELWVIQLTPQQVSSLPTTRSDIGERITHLVANLSLQQELRFVEAVNDWVAGGHLDGVGVTETTVRIVSLYREQAAIPKVDRRPSFIRDLLADGRAEGVGLLQDLDAADG